jgi:hypothetical protein
MRRSLVPYTGAAKKRDADMAARGYSWIGGHWTQVSAP